MKALVCSKPGGLENCSIEEVAPPVGEITVRISYAGMNPVDLLTMQADPSISNPPLSVSPYPHIPGVEFVGIIEDPGKSSRFSKGDRVAVHHWMYDGTCKKCKSGEEENCRNSGIMGVNTNGGYAELFATEEKYLEKVPDSLSMLDAVSIPTGGLTSYHGLRLANLKGGERVLVIGASGNTGQYAVLISQALGAEVYYVSRKKWLNETGASEWDSQTVDIIVNSIGAQLWHPYFEYLDKGGRLVTYGTMTGMDVSVNLGYLFFGQRSIIGTHGGSRKDFKEVIELVSENGLKSRLWKVYDLEDYEKAIRDYPRKDGRIAIKISGDEA